ncbi:thiamine-phosphate kinase [Cognatilysobacter segetis]|uniref:thiamine-phosphate kinase n=1 Tax=Cognatilysobacter segetis TaxID=2492394 RepID=UPI00105FE796|nr:thiamine-phosphate kinase [Lysobacter segetis]
MGAGEFDLIERIRRRIIARDDVVLGIGDDAALLAVPPGMQLVVAMDTLNAGVHFPLDTRPADIGWKALAVNLSDLAAMGATPAWCTLSLSLPAADADWLDAFLDGFGALASLHGVALVGGDTTRGPLSISVTAHGFVATGAALRRDGARIGHDVWISGTPGDAAAALALLRHAPAPPAFAADAAAREALRARLDRPQPRVGLGRALGGIAHAAIDISDGLLADLGHVARASGVHIDVDLDALPASPHLANVARDWRLRWQATGGDDYELAITAPAAARAAIGALTDDDGTRFTRIGRVAAGAGVVARCDGERIEFDRLGYQHFAGAAPQR